MILYKSSHSGGISDKSEQYTVKYDGSVQQGSACSYFSHDDIINSSIEVGNNICDVTWMLDYCTNFGNDVYIKGNTLRDLKVRGLFAYCNNSLQKNVHFNSVFNGIFNNTINSIAGGLIEWTDMTNGFYNATFNIYCYNNYSG